MEILCKKSFVENDTEYWSVGRWYGVTDIDEYGVIMQTNLKLTHCVPWSDFTEHFRAEASETSWMMRNKLERIYSDIWAALYLANAIDAHPSEINTLVSIRLQCGELSKIYVERTQE